jgi:hypothetical protein
VAVTYTQTAINARLNGVVSAIDGGGGPGLFKLYSGGLLVSTITLAVPSGTVAGGALTFTAPRSDLSAAGSGLLTEGRMTDSTGAEMITGLSVGIPFSGANIIVSNGLNTLQVTAGQTVTLLSGQIIGS